MGDALRGACKGGAVEPGAYIHKPVEAEVGFGIYENVEIEFDPAKDAANVEKHGVSLARAADLVPLVFVEDDRFEEPRYRVYGLIDDIPHCLAATARGAKVRAISLRRVHAKELRRYAG